MRRPHVGERVELLCDITGMPMGVTALVVGTVYTPVGERVLEHLLIWRRDTGVQQRYASGVRPCHLSVVEQPIT